LSKTTVAYAFSLPPSFAEKTFTSVISMVVTLRDLVPSLFLLCLFTYPY
jgi:hypothetical protein